ncbi:MAG: CoA transferase [Rhodospirillales bacterium]
MTDQPTDLTLAKLPLAGLVVLDISTYIAAPAASVVLSDFGADVIKVEGLDGDPNRFMVNNGAYPSSAANYPWLLDSRNKRSLAIDLKQQPARAALDRLIAKADIAIVNYPLPVRQRLRLRWDDLRAANARLIYASLTGYGEAGPDVDRPGFDVNAYFARSGIVDGAMYEGMAPNFPVPAQGDRATAMTIVAGVLLALLHRQKTGEGSEIATSLLANGVWANGILAQAALAGAFIGHRPPRTRPRNPISNTYRSADGRWFVMTLLREDILWSALCAATGLPELERDARFDSTAKRKASTAELAAIFEARFLTKSWAEWKPILTAHGLVYSEIQTLQDLPNDRQIAANGIFVETGDAQVPRTIANPINASFAAKRGSGPAPALGQHSDEVLRWAGVSEQEIAALRAASAIK